MLACCVQVALALIWDALIWNIGVFIGRDLSLESPLKCLAPLYIPLMLDPQHNLRDLSSHDHCDVRSLFSHVCWNGVVGRNGVDHCSKWRGGVWLGIGNKWCHNWSLYMLLDVVASGLKWCDIRRIFARFRTQGSGKSCQKIRVMTSIGICSLSHAIAHCDVRNDNIAEKKTQWATLWKHLAQIGSGFALFRGSFFTLEVGQVRLFFILLLLCTFFRLISVGL